MNATLQEKTLTSGSNTIADLLAGLDAAQEAQVAKILSVSWQGSFGLSVANSEAHGRWGLFVVTQKAFTNGEIPNALTDHQYSWYWNEGYALDDPHVEERTIRGQTKTQRTLASREMTLAFNIESSGLSAGTLKYGFSFRIAYAYH